MTVTQLPTTPTAAKLNSLALIKVHGDDAQTFLQRQLSNDVDALAAGGDAQLNAYCNPKGRVLAVIRLMRDGDGYWMTVPNAIADGLVRRLKMFVLRAKVEIDLAADNVLVGTINGDGADTVTGGVTVAGTVNRQMTVAAADKTQSVFATLTAAGYETVADDAFWQLADIRSGIPQVYPPTAEEFIPQMINMDLVDGLSFSKGCYPGQEIVARLRYLGKVKQRMLAATVTGETVSAGDPIFTDGREQKVGLVVDSVATGDGEYTFSATAPSLMMESGTLYTVTPTGKKLTRIDLPYPTPTEKPA